MRLKLGKKIYRKRDVRKFVWIMITAVSALAMVIGTIGPAFKSFQ